MTGIMRVFTAKGIPPIGPYSQAMIANGFVFLSGQMPATLDSNNKIKLTTGSVAQKTHDMCRNAATLLEASGSSTEKVVKVTVYFTNLDDFAEMNSVYEKYFPQRPARSAIEAKSLPAGVSMEMDLIAVV